MTQSTLLLLFDLVLLATLLALAVAALTSPEPRRAVMLFISFGFWLSLVWARLHAPDVALAEAAIGAGLGGALMLAAARRAARQRAQGNAMQDATPNPEPIPEPNPEPDPEPDPGPDPEQNAEYLEPQKH